MKTGKDLCVAGEFFLFDSPRAFFFVRTFRLPSPCCLASSLLREICEGWVGKIIREHGATPQRPRNPVHCFENGVDHRSLGGWTIADAWRSLFVLDYIFRPSFALLFFPVVIHSNLRECASSPPLPPFFEKKDPIRLSRNRHRRARLRGGVPRGSQGHAPGAHARRARILRHLRRPR